MITVNDLLECGFIKCESSSEVYVDNVSESYVYVDNATNNREFWLLDMYVYLYGDFVAVTYTDFTVYPGEHKSTIVDDIEEIKNIISNFDLCIDKYKEVDEHFNRGISILNLVKRY